MTETLTVTVQALATQVAASSEVAQLHYTDVRLSLYIFGLFLAAAVALLFLTFIASVRAR